MRKALLVILAVVVALLIALDRIGLLVADHQIASRVQKSQGLASSPHVSIKGFPFLTQVISGRYGEVDVSVSDVTRAGLTVDRVDVQAHGVSVPLSQVIAGSVKEVPVDRADASVSISFDHINGYVSNQIAGSTLRVAANGDKIKLVGTLPFPPRISVSAKAAIDVSSDAITLRPAALDSLLASIPGGVSVRGRVQQFFTLKLPISQLPFGIRLKAAKVVGNSVVVAASANGLTLRAPSG
jgi:hypothetical protein